jgi:hypothetical protein
LVLKRIRSGSFAKGKLQAADTDGGAANVSKCMEPMAMFTDFLLPGK